MLALTTASPLAAVKNSLGPLVSRERPLPTLKISMKKRKKQARRNATFPLLMDNNVQPPELELAKGQG